MRRTIITAWIAVFWLINFTDAGELKAGFAERDITPVIGMEQPGGYGKVYHKSLHDPCKIRAVVIDDGTNRVALVGVDAIEIDGRIVAAVRKKVEGKCGIKASAILIGASHSHSSGPLGSIKPWDYEGADDFVKDLAFNQSALVDLKYAELVERKLVDVILAADGKKVAVEMGFGRGHEGSVSFNRRFKMKGGLEATHPRYGNPNMLEPAGPIDPEVGVIGVWEKEGGKMLGCVVNFACHATTNPVGISANFPWYLEKVIKDVMGKDVVPVFLNGASGDITQVDNQSPFYMKSGEDMAKVVGGCVGAEAVKVLLKMPRGTEATVDQRKEVMKIARRGPNQAHYEEALELTKDEKFKKENRAGWTFAKETVMAKYVVESEPVDDVEIQTIKVGPAVFVTTPAEYFCQLGLDQKKAIEFPYVWPVSLANDCVGYVPTEEALGKHGGGYETRLTSYTNLIPKAGTMMRDKGIDLANSMKPDMEPEAKRLKASKAGWTYGALPPQLD